ncbi:MAG: efflux RND transporter periplasmic adaptor subunit, partial [Burkholderiales bacterium]|nr:efflux RND transporter periplasmic adaptor subunit [Burkholderiales bacterium]
SVFTAQQRDVPVTVESAGTVVALDSVDVRPQITGTIAEVLVKDGQFVRRGEPLFRLDDRADRANLERAKAQLLRDQATLADLDRQWKRAQELRAQNFIAQSAADTVLANVEAQRAAVAASNAALRSAEIALSYDTISAPLAGRAGAVAVFRGSLVQPAITRPVMVNINQIDPIGVSFTVPETQLAALLRAGPSSGNNPVGRGAPASKPSASAAGNRPAGSGATVSIVLPGAERGRNAPPAEPLLGRVVFVDNAVDTTTGSIRIKAALANAGSLLWPGQYVTVRMTLRTIEGAVVLPQAALIIRGNERSVYIVKPDGTAEMRSVQPRVPMGELLAVDGVQPGEKVVVEGKQNLRPGAPVKDTPYTGGTGGRRGAGASAPTAGASAAAAPM